jgi:hypothetical protein
MHCPDDLGAGSAQQWSIRSVTDLNEASQFVGRPLGPGDQTHATWPRRQGRERGPGGISLGRGRKELSAGRRAPGTQCRRTMGGEWGSWRTGCPPGCGSTLAGAMSGSASGAFAMEGATLASSSTVETGQARCTVGLQGELLARIADGAPGSLRVTPRRSGRGGPDGASPSGSLGDRSAKPGEHPARPWREPTAPG